MSLTDNNTCNQWDPSIPAWKRELILKKRRVTPKMKCDLSEEEGKKVVEGREESLTSETVVDPGMDHGELHASNTKHKEWEIPRIKTGRRMGDVKYVEASKCHPGLAPSPAFSSYSDGFSYEENEEMEYGPGIVDRLRSKFINWTVKDEKQHHQPVRRVASLEHLLKTDSLDGVLPSSTVSSHKRQLPVKRKLLDNLKKARSMETLSTIEKSSGITSVHKLKTTSHPEKLNKAALVNENVVIIDQPKNSGNIFNVKQNVSPRKTSALGSCIEDDELPKPDTVRTFAQLFEGDLHQQKNHYVKNTSTKNKKVWKNSSTVSAKLINCFNEENVSRNGSEESRTSGQETSQKTTKSTNESGGKLANLVEPRKSEVISNKISQFENKNEAAPSDDKNSASSNAGSCPRIVSLKPKIEDNKPVGLIRPLSMAGSSDKKENLINKSKSVISPMSNGSGEVIENNSTEKQQQTASFALRKRSAVSPENENNTLIFNFTGKSDVKPNIRNSESSFSIVRPVMRIDKLSGKLVSNLINSENASGYILVPGCPISSSQDYSDEEDDNSPAIAIPCGIEFEGENISVGKTAFLERRNKQLKIAFLDTATDVYEYPSEAVMLEEYLKNNPSENDTKLENSNQQEEISLVNNTSGGILKPNTALSNLGGLAGYVPSKYCDQTFELGVSKPVRQETTPSSSGQQVASDEETTLKPADDDQASMWSHSQQVETDLLF